MVGCLELPSARVDLEAQALQPTEGGLGCRLPCVKLIDGFPCLGAVFSNKVDH